MARATKQKLQSLADPELKNQFNHQAQDRYTDVLQILDRLTGRDGRIRFDTSSE